jgi:hypothetical protein
MMVRQPNISKQQRHEYEVVYIIILLNKLLLEKFSVGKRSSQLLHTLIEFTRMSLEVDHEKRWCPEKLLKLLRCCV